MLVSSQSIVYINENCCCMAFPGSLNLSSRIWGYRRRVWEGVGVRAFEVVQDGFLQEWSSLEGLGENLKSSSLHINYYESSMASQFSLKKTTQSKQPKVMYYPLQFKGPLFHQRHRKQFHRKQSNFQVMSETLLLKTTVNCFLEAWWKPKTSLLQMLRLRTLQWFFEVQNE